MAIALAANIGGQSSPISSPQNLIALDAMEPPLDWLQWFAVALPVSGVSIILIWLLLLAIYRPGVTSDGEPLSIKPVRATRERFTAKQYYVAAVCIVTIGLWCVAHEIQYIFGDMGIIAIIPIIAFFGTGVLSKVRSSACHLTVIFELVIKMLYFRLGRLRPIPLEYRVPRDGRHCAWQSRRFEWAFGDHGRGYKGNGVGAPLVRSCPHSVWCCYGTFFVLTAHSRNTECEPCN